MCPALSSLVTWSFSEDERVAHFASSQAKAYEISQLGNAEAAAALAKGEADAKVKALFHRPKLRAIDRAIGTDMTVPSCKRWCIGAMGLSDATRTPRRTRLVGAPLPPPSWILA